jgi:HD-GYP domain-containing protein (c-di-GMP phosphodiesterase class II)
MTIDSPTSDDGTTQLAEGGEVVVLVVARDDRIVGESRALLERAGYKARIFDDPEDALAVIAEGVHPVVLKDHSLAAMPSLDFVQRALDHDPFLKVVLLARMGDEVSADLTIRAGAFDFVTTPLGAENKSFSRVLLRATIACTRQHAAHDSEAAVRRESGRQAKVLKKMTVGTLTALLSAQEARTPLFRGHSQAVANCAAGIARTLSLPADQVSAIRTAGLLHDLGMIAVPDKVVNKPDQLSKEEFAHVAAHPRRGSEILAPMDHLGDVPRFVLEHHERVDGSGYPEGKKGAEISLGGQVVALAEYWTAITEDRPFRDRMSAKEAMSTLVGTGGTWFDSELLRALQGWMASG